MVSLMNALTAQQVEYARAHGVHESTLHAMDSRTIVGSTDQPKRITFSDDGGITQDRSP